MLKKILAGIFFIITITVRCDNSRTARDFRDNALDIDNLFKKADDINLPITLTKDSWQHLYEEFQKNFTPKQEELQMYLPCIRVIKKKQFHAFIFVSPDEPEFPELRTVDKEGNFIDDLQLLGIWMGDSQAVETRETTTLNDDHTIRIVQDKRYFELDSSGNRLTNSGKTKSFDFLYQVLENGRIERLR